MPFALAGLGAVALGVFAFITAAGVVWALNGIANLLPKINLGVVVLDLGGWLGGVASSIEQWITEAGESLWQGVADWVNGHTYLIAKVVAEVEGLANRTREGLGFVAQYAVVEAFNRSVHFAVESGLLFKHEVEDSISSAVDTASQLFVPSDWTTYQNPPPGGRTPNRAILAVGAAVAAAAATFASSEAETAREDARRRVKAAEDRAERELHEAKQQIGQAAAEAAQTARENVHTAELTLTGRIATAETTAETHLQHAREALERAIAGSEGAAREQLEDAKTELDTTITTKVAAAKGELERRLVQVEGNITTAEGNARTELETQRAQLVAQIAAGEREAHSQLEQVAGGLEQAILGAEGAARDELEHAKDSITEAISTLSTNFANELSNLFTGTIEDITGAAVAVGGDLTALPALLAAAITVPVTALAGRVKHLEDCAVTECEGPNNIHKILESGVSLAQLLALLAALAAILHDPEAAADTFAETLQTTYHAAISDTESAIESVASAAGGVYTGLEGTLDTLLSL